MGKYSDFVDQTFAEYDQQQGSYFRLTKPSLPENNQQMQAEPEPEPEQGTTWGDYGSAFGMGAGQLVSGAGWLFGSDELEQLGQETTDYWERQLSEPMRESMSKRFITEDYGVGDAVFDPNSWGGVLMQSLPSMVPGIGAAGTATKGAAVLGAGQKLASGIGAGAGSAVEGATIGGMVGRETEQAVLEAPEEQLSQSPYYQDLLKTSDPETARRKVAQKAGEAAALPAGVGGAVLGAAFNKFIGDAVTGRLSKRITKEGMKGAALEGATETAQSGLEAGSKQLALDEYANQPVSGANILNEMAAGGGAGGITGGLIGMAGGVAGQREEPDTGEKVQAAQDEVYEQGGDALQAANASAAVFRNELAEGAIASDQPLGDLGSAMAQSDQAQPAQPTERQPRPDYAGQNAPMFPEQERESLAQRYASEQDADAEAPIVYQQDGITVRQRDGDQPFEASTDDGQFTVRGASSLDARRKLNQQVQRNQKSDPILQNRDRSRPDYVAQMQDIAENPDYDRVSVSREPNSGAPMVFERGETDSIPQEDRGRTETITMDDGQGGTRKVPAQYAVVEADQVTASNQADGTRNEQYGQGGLTALNNGRTAGLQSAFQRGNAGQYVEALKNDEAHGISREAIESKKNPMLVRRFDESALEGIEDLGDASNPRNSADLSASEQASTDARKLDIDTLSLAQQGPIDGPDNQEFARRFIGSVGGAGKNNRLIDSEGLLTQDGMKRIQGALVARAFSDDTLTRELTEATKGDLKKLGDALAEIAPRWALMRERAKEGSINPDMDITDALRASVNMIRKSRQQGKALSDLAAQIDAFSGPTDQMAKDLLSLFYKGKNYTSIRGHEKITDTLNGYLDGALQSAPEPDMFGNMTTPQQALEAQRGETTERTAEQADEQQGAPGVQPDGREIEADGPAAERPVSGTGRGEDAEAGQGDGQREGIAPRPEEIEQAASETDTTPTDPQKEAGNYRKGRIQFQGLDIAIENPKGSTRSGTDPDGNQWETTMAHHYGDIKRTEGADGDNVDVFVGPDTESDQVFVIDQQDVDGSFDEHKVMLGFQNQKAAEQGYLDNYEDGWTIGPVTRMGMDEFKQWLEDGDTTKPLADSTPPPEPEQQDDQAPSTEGVSRSGQAETTQPQQAEGGQGDPRFMFAGPQAETSSLQDLQTAREMHKESRSMTAIRNKTGWFRGVDGQWRYEIDDSNASIKRLNPNGGKPIGEHFSTLIREYDRGLRLPDVLDHPKLFEAYPQLEEMQVGAMPDSVMDGSRGRLSGMNITLNSELLPDQALSTLLHEVQHAIQYREGFAKGASPSEQFAGQVKDAVRQIENINQRRLQDWINDNQDLIDAEREAADLMTYGLMYQSAQRLSDYAKREKPSGVLRLIRRESEWAYHDKIRSGDRELRREFDELDRNWYNLPKRHKMAERNEFIRNQAEATSSLIQQAIPDEVQQRFEQDARSLNGMVKALEREAERARKKTTTLAERRREAQQAEQMVESVRFRSPFEIYQRMAGEIEARNTQSRRNMSEEERRRQSPEMTADLENDEAIVVIEGRNGGTVELPYTLDDAAAPPQQDQSETLTATEARSIASDLMRDWQGRPPVTVADSISEFPRPLRTAIRDAGAEGDMRAVYWNDEIYVLAPRIPNRAAMEEVILHEVVGHYGLRKMLGSDLKPLLNQVYLSFANTAEAREIRQTYFPGNSFDSGNANHRMLVAEELLAHLAESGRHRKLWERVVAKIREGLRKLGFTLNLSENDLLGILQGAQRTVENGGISRPSDADANFSRTAPAQQTQTQAFKDWFGDSAVVDENGDPLVVYHGIAGDIDADSLSVFETGNRGYDPDPSNAFYFTPDKYTAREYTAGDPNNIIAAYLKAENPLDLRDKSHQEEVNGWLEDIDTPEGTIQIPFGKNDTVWDDVAEVFSEPNLLMNEIVGQAKEAGYDSLVMSDGNRGEVSESWAVFEPEQIKSATDNTGTFDPGNPDIRFSRAADAGKQIFEAPEESRFQALVRTVQDKMNPLKQTQKAIQEAGGKVNEGNDAYMAEEAFYGKTEEDLKKIREQYVEPMTEAMAKHDITQEELDVYLIAKHARERNKQIAKINPDMPDGGSGMTNAQADAVLQKVKEEGKQKALEDVAQYVYGMTAKQREILRESGLQSDEITDTWESTYKNYVPLKGWAEDEKQAGFPRIGKGFTIRGKESLRAMGRTTQAASPSATVISDLTEKVIRHRKNEVGNTLLKLVEDNPNPDYWRVYHADDTHKERGIVQVKDEEGNVIEQVRMLAKPMAMLADRYFTTKKDGQTYYIEMNDERLMRAMKNMGPESQGAIVRTMGTINRMLSSLVTSYNPEFTVSNFSRDIQTAILNVLAETDVADGRAAGVKTSRLARRMVKDIPKAMKSISRALRGKEDQGEYAEFYQEFLEDGAKTGFFDMKDVDEQARDLERMVAMARGGVKGNMLKFGKNVSEFVENANSTVENAVRLTVYKNARDAGVSRKKAASLAKNLTVNFNRKGEIGTALNALYMFANASIQGTAQFARVIGTLKIDPETGKKSLNKAQKAAMGLVGASFALAALNREMGGEDDDGEDWYDKIPDYERERNLILMKSLFGGEQDGSYWKIPLPYGYNIFHVMGDNFQSVVSGNREISKSAVELTMAMAGSFSPIGLESSEDTAKLAAKTLTPTIGKPWVQLAVNETFYGAPIYRENYAFGPQKPDSELVRKSTKEHWAAVAQWMNKATGGTGNRPGLVDINPDSLDHLFSFFTGGAGTFVSRSADYARSLATGEEIETRNIPFRRKLDNQVRDYKDINQFYERQTKLEQIAQDVEDARGPERARLAREYREELRLERMAKLVSRQLRQLREAKDRIESANLPPARKRKMMDQIQERMDTIVDRFNKQYNERR